MLGTELSAEEMEINKREMVSAFRELIDYWVGANVTLRFINLFAVRHCARHLTRLPKQALLYSLHRCRNSLRELKLLKLL